LSPEYTPRWCSLCATWYPAATWEGHYHYNVDHGSSDMTIREYAQKLDETTLRIQGDLSGINSVCRGDSLPEIGDGCKADLKPPAPNHKSAKPPMHALPLDRLGGLSRALSYGDDKYEVRNWVGTAKDPRLYVGAVLRHLAAIQAGQMIDPESGLPHVNHLQASAVILEEALRNAGLLK